MSARKKAPAKPKARKAPKAKAAPAKPKDKKTKPLELLQAEGHGVCLSLTEIADEFSRDWESIKKRIIELDIRPSGKRNGYPVYRLRDLMRMERVDADGNLDPARMKLFDRSTFFKSELDRLKLERETGQLYQRAEIETELSRVFRVINQELETLVDVLERDVQPSPVILSRIEEKVLCMRERMYQEIAAGKTTRHSIEAAAIEAAGVVESPSLAP